MIFPSLVFYIGQSRKRSNNGHQSTRKRTKLSSQPGQLIFADGRVVDVQDGDIKKIDEVTLSVNILANGSLKLSTTRIQSKKNERIESYMSNLTYKIHMRETDIEDLRKDIKEFTDDLEVATGEVSNADTLQQIANLYRMIGHHKE